MRITVEYCENGLPVSDFNCEKIYQGILEIYQENKRDINLKISNEILIERLALGIVQDQIDCEDLFIIFKNERLYMNKHGIIIHWPSGFCDTRFNIIHKKIQLETTKRKKIREIEN